MIAQGSRVRHVSDRALGIGEIKFSETQAGIQKFYVQWPSGFLQHPGSDLEALVSLPDRMTPDRIGQAAFDPFILRVLGRWFEARHALTGELSNQPFQMLPHQVIVANRVVNSAADGRRWLIADDVGLGKTIEAGMILEVLRRRAIGRFRCLIVAPAGLAQQWKEEMDVRFRRHFRLFGSRNPNELEESDQIIASIDTLKQRKLEVALKNVTPWDLVVFDEAHHLATESTVQKYDLARRLHDGGLARNTLFLTATPHSGNSQHFYNMLKLLRPDLFKTEGDVTAGDGRLNQVMIRNRKSEVTDAQGVLIFKGIAPAKILEVKPSVEEVAFYEALLAFVKEGYGVAKTLRTKGKDSTNANAVGFLMSTFRKLASSSREAIHSALRNRLRALEESDSDELNLEQQDERYMGEMEERQAITAALSKGSKARSRNKSPIHDEIRSIHGLLDLLNKIQARDSKLTYFLDAIPKLLPNGEKALIFTEYRGTQRSLVEALVDVFGSESVGEIHGSMDIEARQAQVQMFNNQALPRFLVSTEAGGEGLNMQRACHVIFNYDLPWNPGRLQQRIGRVYRYGQNRPVYVYNLRLKSESDAFADARVEEYLERKIVEITLRLAEVQGGKPEDFRNDVLGQVSQSLSLEELYERTVTEGEAAACRTIDQESQQLQQILEDPEGSLGLFKGLRCFDISDYQLASARVSDEALQFFVTRYLGHEECPPDEPSKGLLSFRVPKSVREAASRTYKSDPYESRREILETRLERATVSRALSRDVGAKLLRFGDPVFDGMVRHVQDSDFSEGTASVQMPADALGWSVGSNGFLVVFELKVQRQEGSLGGARVLRQELASFLVPSGGTPVLVDSLIERLHEALPGRINVELTGPSSAYAAAKTASDDRLRALFEACVKDVGSDKGLVPQADDFAMACVEAI